MVKSDFRPEVEIWPYRACAWTRKCALNFGGNPDPESGPDTDCGSRPYSPWRRYAISDCSCCISFVF